MALKKNPSTQFCQRVALCHHGMLLFQGWWFVLGWEWGPPSPGSLCVGAVTEKALLCAGSELQGFPRPIGLYFPLWL